MLALTVALLLQTSAAPVRPPPSNDDLPKWSKTPDAGAMTAAYPAAAKAQNLAGSAAIDCTVDASGDLSDCVVASETPEGQGFGAAALSLASQFRLGTKAPSGAATAGRTVRIPLRWLNPAKRELPMIQIPDENGRQGAVVFNCRVGAERLLNNCVAVDARPQGTNLFRATGEAVLRQKAPPSVATGERVLIVVQVR